MYLRRIQGGHELVLIHRDLDAVSSILCLGEFNQEAMGHAVNFGFMLCEYKEGHSGRG